MSPRDELRLVGVLFIVYAALVAGVGAVLTAVTGMPLWVAAVIGIIALVFLVAGAGLVALRPWARVFGFVAAAISIVNVPLGTAVAVYAIIVLRRPASQNLFWRPSGPAQPSG